MSNPSKTLKSILVWWIRALILVGLVLYLILCTGYAVLQRRLIYQPPHFTAAQVEGEAATSGLKRWRTAAGRTIGMERLSPSHPTTGCVLIVYGAGSWSLRCASYADQIQAVAPCDIFVLEYPGYADRTGVPTERNLFQAADEALQALGANQPVYVVGESLGTGVAAYLAGTHPEKVAGLILLSPFNRLTDVAQYRKPFLPARLLLVDRFPSEDYLRNYHGPVGIVVDGQDDVVPEKFGRRLGDGYTGPKQFWEFPYGYHTSIMEPPTQFWKEVMNFWQSNRPSATSRKDD